MGRNNPINVDYYTYKVEFQERGAGHIHGTLWLKMDKLEELVKCKNGDLKPRKEVNPETVQEETPPPFLGINSAFRKIKNGEVLNTREIESLKNC